MRVENSGARFVPTAFRASKFAYALTAISKDKQDLVEIYKLTRRDAPFIRRCINVINGKDRILPNDVHGIYDGEPKKAFSDFFKNILKSGFDDREQAFIAIRNNEKIEGVAGVFDGTHPARVTNCMILRDDSASTVENSLMYSVLRAVSKRNNLIINKRGCNQKVADFIGNTGIRLSNGAENYYIINSRMSIVKCANMLRNDKNSKIKNSIDKAEYDLQKVLDLD